MLTISTDVPCKHSFQGALPLGERGWEQAMDSRQLPAAAWGLGQGQGKAQRLEKQSQVLQAPRGCNSSPTCSRSCEDCLLQPWPQVPAGREII